MNISSKSWIGQLRSCISAIVLVKYSRNSMMFPFALSVLGLLIIYLGIKYQRNREAIEAAILNSLPDGLKNLRPAAR